jgi:1,4-alpha-glucan branching enzyme
MWTRPGKKLLFMGSELAPQSEWTHRESLDWNLGEQPQRRAFARLLEELGRLYGSHPCLWRSDPDPGGFRWIDAGDRTQSVISYVRASGNDELLVFLNATPVPRDDYRVGVPHPGRYREVLNTDARDFGGSGHPTAPHLDAEPQPSHGLQQSLRLGLPPLACVALIRESGT